MMSLNYPFSPLSLVSDFFRLLFRRLYQPCDMQTEMLRGCIDIAKAHLLKVKDWHEEGDAIVQKLKDELDARYGQSWQVSVGKHFGCKVTHESKHFTSFYINDFCVLFFRC